MRNDTFREILALLRKLDEAKIWYRMAHSRDDAITIEVVVPGERWEIDFTDYGDQVQIEIECFRSDGTIHDESKLQDLFARFSDKDEPVAHDGTVPRN
jgi:hypothetical protein